MCVLPNDTAGRVDTALSANGDAAHPVADGSGGAAGNAACVSRSTTILYALRGHVDARLDEQIDVLT